MGESNTCRCIPNRSCYVIFAYVNNLVPPFLARRREVFESFMSSTTFGFGLCLDAWQTLGVLFSYLNSVAVALMLAGVIYKVWLLTKFC